ncbi:hypothetical protein EPI10_023656 [Gossypium australe]|uniref:Uncharacterized protein n=1 Tax=Gossypium australe TaxID=47621 RepID=A0A5B6VVE7_9ROSI|nr:hypothetical protein EPI10_023656 [Gossypium australe]
METKLNINIEIEKGGEVLGAKGKSKLETHKSYKRTTKKERASGDGPPRIILLDVLNGGATLSGINLTLIVLILRVVKPDNLK